MATVISCPICMEYFTNHDEVHSTLCGHVYHLNCLSKWKMQENSCPQCRRYDITSHKVYFSLVEESEVTKKFQEIKHNYEITNQNLEQVEKNNSVLQLELDQSKQTVNVLKSQIEELVTKISALESNLEEKAEKLEKLHSQFDESVLNGSRIELELETVKKEFLQMQSECTRANETSIDLQMHLQTMQIDSKEKDDRMEILCLEKYALEQEVNQIQILKINYLDALKKSANLSFAMRKIKI